MDAVGVKSVQNERRRKMLAFICPKVRFLNLRLRCQTIQPSKRESTLKVYKKRPVDRPLFDNDIFGKRLFLVGFDFGPFNPFADVADEAETASFSSNVIRYGITVGYNFPTTIIVVFTF